MSDESLPDPGAPIEAAGASPKPKDDAAALGFWERSMMLAIGVPRLWGSRPKFLRSIEEARKRTLDVFIVGVGLVLVVVVVKATLITVPVVEAFAVPKSLEERGYSGTVIAQRLLDRVHDIGREAHTLKERVRVGTGDNTMMLSSIQLPSTGLNLRSIVSAVRDAFGLQDNKIGGEVTIAQRRTKDEPERYSLLLRFDSPRGRTSKPFSSENLDEMLHEAALAVVEQYDPYVLASYFSYLNDWEKMDGTINRLIAGTDSQAMTWALMLRGNQLSRSGKPEKAIEFYERAISIDPTFANAYYNWGVALVRMERDDEALAKYDEALQHNARHASAYNNRGAIFARQKDRARVIADYRRAVELDPTALYHRNLGNMLVEEEDYGGAIEHYWRALSKEPDKYQSLAGLIDDLKPKKEERSAVAATVATIFWERTACTY